MMFRPPDVLFVPAHSLPPLAPAASVATIHDLGYLQFPAEHPPATRLLRDAANRWSAARARRVIAGRAPTGAGPAGAPETPAAPAPPDAPGAPAAPDDRASEGTVCLGIDPGTATTGYSFVRQLPGGEGAYRVLAYGVVETAPEEPMPRRLLRLYRALSGHIAAHRPAEAAVERLFFGRNTTTAISVGQARGVVLLALAEAGVPVAEYTPAEVKQALAGFGRAQKVQIQRMTQALLDLPQMPHPDDAADALAIAIAHAHHRKARAMAAAL
jgi:crossover junction endodeoxyribonuclease RuvC